MDARKIIIARLMSNHGVRTETELMNILQDTGAVSDECVNLADVADCDLMAAYNRTITGE